VGSNPVQRQAQPEDIGNTDESDDAGRQVPGLYSKHIPKNDRPSPLLGLQGERANVLEDSLSPQVGDDHCGLNGQNGHEDVSPSESDVRARID
jgi:hypothetical protein